MSEKAFADCSPPYMNSLPEPSVAHRILTQEETPKRLIVVGDLHGCFDELQELLTNCNYQSPNTKVLIVGDVVNKGPKSVETLRFVKENNFLCIRGNHDDFILASILNLIPELKITEGLKFINQLSTEEVEWLKELPYSIRIPEWNALFVHAGLIPSIPVEEHSRGELTTLRNVISAEEDKTKFTATSRPDIGIPWITAWDDHQQLQEEGKQTAAYHVYFGHDAKRGLQLGKYATGLDTGCLYGKKLTAIVLPSREIFQVDAKKEYVPVGGRD